MLFSNRKPKVYAAPTQELDATLNIQNLRTIAALLMQIHNISPLGMEKLEGRKKIEEFMQIMDKFSEFNTQQILAALQFGGAAEALIVVSEAGASVYSASALAAEEFPDLDVTFRGAVSIARRLQDPLAELVKIEPKSIGVGQYQHDVNQTQLGRSLEAVVEDCVNNVGVDVNTASTALLARVAGLNQQLAGNIVSYRNQHGIFSSRDVLKQVSRLGPKAFEQAAGFLRIMGGENPLDSSAVHPESYSVVSKILAQTNKSIRDIIANKEVLAKLEPKAFVDDKFGLPTVVDIIKELEKPGRDPRPEFKTAQFQAGVNTLNDLKPDMILEGVVTNVANFGAFVDIGVHQDGLVHISALANKFVKDPRDVVKTGEIVKVKVLEVDLARKRISLSMRLTDAPPAATTTTSSQTATIAQPKPKGKNSVPKAPQAKSLFGEALLTAMKNQAKTEETIG